MIKKLKLNSINFIAHMGNLNLIDLIFFFPPHLNGQVPTLHTWPMCSVKYSLCLPTWFISSSLPVRTIQVGRTISTAANGWHSSTYSPLWRHCIYMGGWQARLLVHLNTSLGRWSPKCYHSCTCSCLKTPMERWNPPSSSPRCASSMGVL